MSETVRIVARTLLVAAGLAVLLWLGPGTSHQQPITAQIVDPCAAPVASPVACENTLPGNPRSEWDITGAGDSSIQGFATDISVNRGETVRFKVDTTAASYRLDIYRLGYYGGAGARKVATVTPSATLPQVQPACTTEAASGLVDCGLWQESASWAVPPTAVSGVYLAKLVRTDGTDGVSHIVFVVRNDTSQSALLFQTSDTTWQAYNRYGGNSLYVGAPAGRAYKVSYNRPFTTRQYAPEDWLFNAEYPMLRWLEANGYDVSYTTGVDTDRRGAELLEHKVFLSVGHDEYWSGDQRANVEAARDAGVHLAFFSGNEVFWKSRYEPSIDGSNTSYRTLVCYKDTHANAKIDPLGGVWTGTWRDTRFSPPNDGGRPENALTGTIYTVNEPATTSIEIPAAYSQLRFWRNTSVAALTAGQTASLSNGTLGYEWDEALANGSQPAGLVRLSSTTRSVTNKLLDYGTTYGPGSATHSLTLYRKGDALVFGAGTVQWSWGLDATHDREASVPDLRVQQATVNLFADMGVSPVTPQANLVVTPAPEDGLAPISSIATPTAGAVLVQGVPVTISGTASDSGGVVAGVEVSTDGGATWKPATGGTSWSFAWTPTATGARTLLSRAVDDSGNLEVPAGGVAVTVAPGLADSCPCTLWSDSTVPPVTDGGGDSPVELGVKFTSTVNGYITGIRFYKSAANTGTHVGSLYTSTGTRLGSVTFADETESGWQTANFDTPIAVTANTTYVASYHTRVGHYAYASQYFATAAVTSGPLRAPAATTTANGVYRYGNAGTFPTESYRSTNYWVDVVFNLTPDTHDTTAPVVASTSPAAGANNATITSTVSASFSEGIDPATIGSGTFELRTNTGTLVPATVAYAAATRTATLTPSSPLQASTAYTALIRGGAAGVKDNAGNPLAEDFAWGFSVLGDTTPPTVSSVSPAGAATGVSASAIIRAVFSEPVSPATVSSNTVELRDASNSLVAALVGYDAATRTATLVPTAPLAALTTYTATVKGGALDPRVKDLEGNALAANFTWSFTTAAAAPSGCPCSLFGSTATPAVLDGFDTRAVELGVKFRSDADGYITAIRFYKSPANTGVHKGSLWTSTGTLISSVTFQNETASGWQQANFPAPVPITANTVYVASYHAPVGRYSFSGAAFVLGLDNPPLHALANSVSPNGVYRYTSTSAFPTDTYNSANYWVDVVYSATPGSGDTTPPSVSSVSPVAGAVGIGTGTSISATFSEALDGATISSSTFELRNGNAVVAASVSWNAGTRTAVLQPTAALQYATTYTVRLKGGAAAPHVTDAAGNAMATDYVWSFTTGSAPVTPPADGPGGPILVVTDPSNPFGRYYGEILRNEGLNAFAMMNVSTLTPAILAGYDVVILSEITLTPAQVNLFANWVAGGGNLIAMRPDKQLASLLGLSDTGATLANAYLRFGATGPGAGLVQETIQYHGAADRYLLDGAVALATLYSDAATATASPAVSLRALAAGGQAAAFSYDLARSVVYTRQGNPAWASQDRDGNVVVRSNDMFFGNAAGDPQPDWVDFSKIQIPQADEQMRLLKNLVIQMTLARKPLPSFWYFPRGGKAVVVMTGDDHARGGTAGRFDSQKAASAPGCSVDDWTCVRSTSYVYPETPLTAEQVATYTADGFEVALHITNGCSNTSATTLDAYVTEQLQRFAKAFPGAPAPATNRTHCVPWNDYTSQATVDLAHGIRLDTTYYYWPDTWIADRPGLFTGSGMPMRFAKANGETVDVYQATTQMTDESGQTYPKNIDALLDKALGPEGYYGAFVTNMHTDLPFSASANHIITSARNRNVPVISARQLLTWLDGRNASSFGSIEWATNLPNAPLGGSRLRFSINVASGANGLEAMVPRRLVGGASVMTSMSRNGVALDPSIRTIKGIEYAVFPAAPGAYEVMYDTTAPVTTFTSAPASRTNSPQASFAFSANEAGSTFECRLDGSAFAACSSPVQLADLTTGAHTFEVRATDTAGNVSLTPASASWTIDLVAPTVTGRTPAPDATGVALNTAITVQFSEAIAPATLTTATLRIRKAGTTADLPASVTLSGTSATLQPSSGLALGAEYEVTLDASVADTAGNALGTALSWRFATNGELGDSTAADFSAGTFDAFGRVALTGDGEVMLAATEGSEFTGTTLPAGWSTTAWNAGGTSTVSGGALVVNAARTHPAALFGPGRALEFSGTFGNDSYQHVGFGVTFNETPWAIFSTFTGGGLYARTHNGVTAINTLIPGNWLGTSHRYRIEWNAGSVVYFIDGVQVASHALTISASMRPIVSDVNASPVTVRVDWLRMTPFAPASTFTSRVFDAAAAITWTTARWNADLPAGTALQVSVRAGNTATPDASWTAFTPVAASGGAVNVNGRYVQYRVELTTTSPAASPALRDLTLTGVAQ